MTMFLFFNSFLPKESRKLHQKSHFSPKFPIYRVKKNRFYMPQPIVFNRLMLKTTSAGVLFRFSCKEKQKINAKIGWKNFFSFFFAPPYATGVPSRHPRV
jgi:hypothetical protein